MDRKAGQRTILHCIPSLGGGGAERQIAYIARAGVRAGWEVHLVFQYDGPNFDLVRTSGVVLHRLAPMRNHDPRLLLQIRDIITTVMPDVVQTWIPQMDVIGGFAALSLRVPFILSERTSAYNGGWKAQLRNWVGARAAAVVANSNSGLSYWLEKNSSPLNRVIRNGVPFDAIEEAKFDSQGYEIPDDAEVVLYAGRFHDAKNVLCVHDCLERVARQRPKALCLMFGAGELGRPLKEREAASPVRERVRVLPYTKQLAGWLKRASTFVSLSRFEGQPNTVLEAAAARCPLVLSDIREHREFLDESCAMFAPANDTAAAARAVVATLEDRAGAGQRADIAFARVRPYSVEALSQEFTELYLQIINGRCAGSQAVGVGS